MALYKATLGGAVYSKTLSEILMDENTRVSFIGNKASSNGGAIYSDQSSSIAFDGDSIVVFAYNEAGFGGAMYSYSYSQLL